VNLVINCNTRCNLTIHLDANGNPKRLQVGMVGYPNVGKSSTINVLVGEKKVAVAAQPGKTKHFQVLLVT
jgi:large subunit GTPase 1